MHKHIWVITYTSIAFFTDDNTKKIYKIVSLKSANQNIDTIIKYGNLYIIPPLPLPV